MRREILLLVITAGLWTAAALPADQGSGPSRGEDLIFADGFETADASRWSQIVDTSPPPEVTITSPVNEAHTNQTTIEVLGTLSKPARVDVEGVEALVVGTSFSAGIPLPIEGINSITATATDILDRTGTDTVEVTLDTVAPVVTLTSPTPDTNTNATSLTVTGLVDGPSTVRVNGIEVDLIDLAFSIEVDIAEGANVIVAEANDLAGNLGTDSLAVLRDTIPPVLAISSPADGAILVPGTTTVTGTVFDAAAGIVNKGECTVTVNGVEAQVANGSWAAFNVPIAAGEGTITAVALDRLGNTSNQVVSVLGNSRPAAAIAAISGDGQNAVAGNMVGQPLVVQVTDSSGTPVSNVDVTFRVARGDGSLDAGARVVVVATDINGEAEVDWTLGSRTGAASDRVEATADGYLGIAGFCASATPASSRFLAVAGGASQRAVAGQLATMPLIALVTDEHGNPVSDQTVTFEVVQGSSLLDGLTTVDMLTDDDGHAMVMLTTGSEIGVGTQRVEASVVGAPDPIHFTASPVSPMPGRAAAAVSGVVMTNENTPIAGAHVYVDGTDPLIEGYSDSEGGFSLNGIAPGPILLHVDGSTGGSYPGLEFELMMLPGIDNSMDRPVYLPLVDADGIASADEGMDVVLHRTDTPGLSLTITAGSATFADGTKTGDIQILRVNSDKIPMTPPDGTVSNMPISIQPASVRFDPPARLRLPNTEGRAPGEVVTLSSFDHDVGQFIPVGTMQVTEDGAFLESEPGQGIIKGGWHRPVPVPSRRTTTPVNQKKVLKCAWNTAGTAVECFRCRITKASANPPSEYPPTVPSNADICNCKITNYTAGTPDTPDFDCFNFTFNDPANPTNDLIQPCALAEDNSFNNQWTSTGIIQGSQADFDMANPNVTALYKNNGDPCIRRFEQTIPFNGVGPNAPGTCRAPTTGNPLGLPICCPNGHWDGINDICCIDPVVGGICI